MDYTPENLLTVRQVAERLNVCTKTVYRMINENMFENLVVMQGLERVRYRITEQSLQKFVLKYSRPHSPETRVYHRRKVKGKHMKKRAA